MSIQNMNAMPPRPNEEPYLGKPVVRFREGLGRKLPSLLDKYDSYVHFKGFASAALIFSPLLANLTKAAIGKRRPCYEAALQSQPTLTRKEKNDLEKSFYSGHAATSFTIATYSSLYLWRNVLPSNRRAIAWKTPTSILTLALAGYVASTRVKDFQHEPVDVITGCAAGASVATIAYIVNERARLRKKREASNAALKRLHFRVVPDRIFLALDL